MKAKKKKIPPFKNEEEERAYWSERDSTEFLDWTKANPTIFPKLKPTLKSISIRLPESMIEQLKVLANKRDLPYQSLLKIYLSDKISQELNHIPS